MVLETTGWRAWTVPVGGIVQLVAEHKQARVHRGCSGGQSHPMPEVVNLIAADRVVGISIRIEDADAPSTVMDQVIGNRVVGAAQLDGVVDRLISGCRRLELQVDHHIDDATVSDDAMVATVGVDSVGRRGATGNRIVGILDGHAGNGNKGRALQVDSSGREAPYGSAESRTCLTLDSDGIAGNSAALLRQG